jgi:hypothetical protein
MNSEMRPMRQFSEYGRLRFMFTESHPSAAADKGAQAVIPDNLPARRNTPSINISTHSVTSSNAALAS